MSTSLSKTHSEFELLINQNTGNKLEHIIENLLESDIINIEKLINLPNIEAIKNTKHYNTLLLLSRGNLSKYFEDKERYIPLSEKMLLKLRKVTFLDIISLNKVPTFELLISLLKFENELQLHRFLFECFTKQLFKGKVDNQKGYVRILEVKPRDFILDWNTSKQQIQKWIERIEHYEEYIQNQRNQIKCCNEDYSAYLLKNVK